METLREKIHKHGRLLIANLYALVKVTGMYDSMNETVLNAAKRLISNLEIFLGDTGEITVKVMEGLFYVEGERIRASSSDIENFTYLAEELKKKSIGVLEFRAPLQADDLIYLAYAIKGGAEAAEVQSALESKLTRGITVGGPVFFQMEGIIDLKDGQTVARYAYLRAIAAAKEVDASIKTGRPPDIKKVKKAIQSMVGSILSDESYILGFTTVRDVANYNYHHCANVAILSATLGKRVGFNKVHLSRLAMAAFFHDIGKAEIPLSILNKKTDFSPKEKELIERHPVDGIKILLKAFGLNEVSIISMLVSYEHHMKSDLSGYPRTSAGRRLNLMSRIVGMADDFDAMVSGKVYSRTPLRTEEALKAMFEGSGTLYDPSLMKAFIGIFK
ncbi:MAG: HD domain-containing protein [Thermodesulfovibrionales bacterium]|nr:HD domain-containing protein [Thermodesulfovibrionales bacterium]